MFLGFSVMCIISITRSKFQIALPLILGLFFLLTPAYSQSVAYKALLEGLYDNKFPTVKPEQIQSLSAYQILDTREKEEFEVSHLPGAIWVGYDSFNLETVADLEKDQPILVYCTVGARSQAIGKKLIDDGFTRVFNLYGGIIHWANETKPLMANDQATDRVHTYSRSWGIWLNKGEKVY